MAAHERLTPWKRLAQAFSLRANAHALGSPAREHYRPVDGLRALSIVWVVLFHTAAQTGVEVSRDAWVARFMRRGMLGVSVFFVISGFLMGTLVMRELDRDGAFSMSRFYARRALRILPAYYAALVCFWLWDGTHVESVWANLLFVNNFLPDARQCMKWSWSLAIEEQFYLCFPWFMLAVYRLRRGRIAALVATLALAFAIRAALIARHGFHLPFEGRNALWNDLVVIHPYARYGELMCGVLAAAALHHTDLLARLPRLPWRHAVTALSVVVVIDSAFQQQPIFQFHWAPWVNFVYYTGATYLFTMAVSWLMLLSLSEAREGRWLARALSARWLYPIGQLSYAAYLLHLILIHQLLAHQRILFAADVGGLVLNCVVVLALTFLAATAMRLLVERPLMNLRRA